MERFSIIVTRKWAGRTSSRVFAIHAANYAAAYSIAAERFPNVKLEIRW